MTLIVRIAARNLVRVTHEDGLAVVLLDLVGIAHFVHSDHLPRVAFPEDGVECTQEDLYMLLLRLHVPWHCRISCGAWHAYPLINATLQSLLRVVPLVALFSLSLKKVFHSLTARFFRLHRWLSSLLEGISLGSSGILLVLLLRHTEIIEIEVTETVEEPAGSEVHGGSRSLGGLLLEGVLGGGGGGVVEEILLKQIRRSLPIHRAGGTRICWTHVGLALGWRRVAEKEVG